MATNDGRVLGIQTKYNVTQQEMIEGDKTAAANIFLTNISSVSYSQSQAPCNVSYTRIRDITTTTINGNKKRSHKDGHLHCHAAFFCSKEWQQWQGKLQPLEDETGYKKKPR